MNINEQPETRKAIVRYTANVHAPPGGVFILPLGATCNSLEKRIRTSPWSKNISAAQRVFCMLGLRKGPPPSKHILPELCLLERLTRNSDSLEIDLSYSEWVAMQLVLIELLNVALHRDVLCTRCNGRSVKEEMQCEVIGYDKGPLAQRNGRKWICSMGHELTYTWDLLS